jgi:hypothetical protein
MYIEENFHWKEAICTGLSLVAGIGLAIGGLVYFATSGQDDAFVGILNGLGGVVLFIVAVASFNITDGWKHANDLPIGKKIVAYLPVFATGIAFIVMLVFFYMVKEALKDSFKS